MARDAVAFEVATQEDAKPAGAYCFMQRADGTRVGIVHACPCGCGSQGAMWFKGLADAGGPEWSVTGEWPKVTLSPSIGFGKLNGSYHWHGFLENGVFVEK